MNIIQIYKQFPTNQDCINHLELVRWNGTPVCPYCKTDKSTKMQKGNRYHCYHCLTSYSVTVKTIFHSTKLDLQKWFLAITLVLNAKKSLSARQLARDIEVNKDTAWRILMKIREAMTQYGDLLEGIVEADETYIGGKEKNKHADKKVQHSQGGANKTIVAGLIERGTGRVIAKKVKNRKGGILKSNIKRNVAQGSTVMTDEHKGYTGLKGYDHKRCNHSRGQYVLNGAHCNTAEGFWSLFKRGISGQWHQISDRWMNHYLAEFSFRYEHRNNPEIFNLTLQNALGL